MTPAVTDIVAVTGANGFVGSAVCSALAMCGTTVRPLTRATGYDLAGPVPPLDGVRAVVHCAHDPIDPQRNLDGTLRLASAGCGQFVFISSLAAHAGVRSAYGRTKLELERRLSALVGPTVTILKPGTILGPGGLFARVRRLSAAPVLPVFYGSRTLQTVLIDDVCAAVAVALDRRLAGTFVVAEPDGVMVTEFYRGVAAVDGRRPWLVPVPGGLVLPLVRLAERLGLRPPVSSDNLLGLKHLAHFDTGPSRAALGIAPREFHDALRSVGS